MADSSKYYVLRGDKALAESMTKEQILSAITQAVEGHEIHDVDTGFVEKIKEQKSGANLKFWVGTTAEYNALAEHETGCFYFLTDDTTHEDIEQEISDLQDDVEEIQQTLADQVTPNTVVYGNSGDTPVYSGDTETPATFNIPSSILIGKYGLFMVEIANKNDLSTATDIQRLLIYSNIKEDGDHYTFLNDNKINRIEESPELANSLRSVAYEVEIYIEGVTQTQRELSLICNRVYLNLSSRATGKTKYYLHKIIGII